MSENLAVWFRTTTADCGDCAGECWRAHMRTESGLRPLKYPVWCGPTGFDPNAPSAPCNPLESALWVAGVLLVVSVVLALAYGTRRIVRYLRRRRQVRRAQRQQLREMANRLQHERESTPGTSRQRGDLISMPGTRPTSSYGGAMPSGNRVPDDVRRVSIFEDVSLLERQGQGQAQQ